MPAVVPDPALKQHASALAGVCRAQLPPADGVEADVQAAILEAGAGWAAEHAGPDQSEVRCSVLRALQKPHTACCGETGRCLCMMHLPVACTALAIY